MKALIVKAICLSVAVMVSCLAIYLHNPLHTSLDSKHYLAAIFDKHNLLQKTPSPRIIFAGGSNVAFGIDSQEVEEKIGLPVINTGLHYGLGVPFIVRDLERFIRKGDVVILSFEYYMIAGNAVVKKSLIDLDPASAPIMCPGFYSRAKLEIEYSVLMLVQGFERLQETFVRVPATSLRKILGRQVGHSHPKPAEGDQLYRRASFSDHGDMIASLTQKPYPALNNRKKLEQSDCSEAIKALNEFAQNAKAKGAFVYFSYPSFCQSEFNANKKAIHYWQREFETHLQMKVIDTPETFVYPDSLFLDTVYHLIDQGRKKRTDALISLIKTNILPIVSNTREHLAANQQ
jgi:hypothetical protein